MSNNKSMVTGAILAGGLATRMGGIDKGVANLKGRMLIEWVLDRLAPQVSNIIINANRSHQQYAKLGYTVVADTVNDFRGPLAGVAAILSKCETPWLMTVPCDSPLIPLDLVSRLRDQVFKENSRLGVVHDGERLQPVFMFLHRYLLEDLNAFLDNGGRKIDHWLSNHSFETVSFSDCKKMFLNANTLDDLERAQASLNSS